MKTGKALPHSERMAPAVGFEPTTNRLTADRSTTELRWIAFGECGAYSCVAIRAGQALLWGQKKTARAAFVRKNWLRGLDLNQRPSGYEPDELPGCSTPRFHYVATDDEIKRKTLFAERILTNSRNGSSGRIRTYDQSVNSRPLYH